MTKGLPGSKLYEDVDQCRGADVARYTLIPPSSVVAELEFNNIQSSGSISNLAGFSDRGMPGEWSGTVVQSRGNNLMYTTSDIKLWLESEQSNSRVLKMDKISVSTRLQHYWYHKYHGKFYQSIERCSSWSGVSYLILASRITGVHNNMPCSHLKSKMRRFIPRIYSNTTSQMPYHTHPIMISVCSACAQNNCRTRTQNRLKSKFGTGYQLACLWGFSETT